MKKMLALLKVRPLTNRLTSIRLPKKLPRVLTPPKVLVLVVTKDDSYAFDSSCFAGSNHKFPHETPRAAGQRILKKVSRFESFDFDIVESPGLGEKKYFVVWFSLQEDFCARDWAGKVVHTECDTLTLNERRAIATVLKKAKPPHDALM